jgi:hypothetical protein
VSQVGWADLRLVAQHGKSPAEVVVPSTRRDGWASGVRRSPQWAPAPGTPIRARERPGAAYDDNGLSKVIAIYAAQGGLTTK